MITYNRAGYVRLSLPRLLETCRPDDRVWVWHNGTHQETIDAVREHEGHPNIAQVHFSNENLKLREPTNWFWAQAGAPFLGKVDDDCLMPDGWIDRLIEIHNDSEQAGILSCWPFLAQDLQDDLVARKMVRLGGHAVMANPWVGGAGYIMKRQCQERCGPLGETEGFTTYCMRVCRAGWAVGWPMPPLVMDHMDDPRSQHTVFKTDADVLAHRGLTATWRGIDTVAGMTERVREAALELQTGSSDWRDYLGWRGKVRRAVRRLAP
ncbi:MAG: glycosyltransferase [Phycisphaerales bacterium]